MPAAQSFTRSVDFESLNASRCQRSRYLFEVASIANGINFSLDLSSTDLGDGILQQREQGFPPLTQVYTHNGGLEAVAGAATLNVNNGETTTFSVWDAEPYDEDTIKNAEDIGLAGVKYKLITHTLSGVTNGAATPTELVASLQSNTELMKWVYPAHSIVVANKVMLLPRGHLGRIKSTPQETDTAINWTWPSGVADNATRTFMYQTIGAALWNINWNANTKVITVTNNTGGLVVRAGAYIRFF